MCIAQELAVNAVVGEVTADAMSTAVDDRVSIIMIYFSMTFLLSGSFGFRRCGISTLFLILNLCDVNFSISSSTLALRSLYSEALFTGCSCTLRMFVIYCCCAVNASLSCRIALADSSLSPTELVV